MRARECSLLAYAPARARISEQRAKSRIATASRPTSAAAAVAMLRAAILQRNLLIIKRTPLAPLFFLLFVCASFLCVAQIVAALISHARAQLFLLVPPPSSSALAFPARARARSQPTFDDLDSRSCDDGADLCSQRRPECRRQRRRQRCDE